MAWTPDSLTSASVALPTLAVIALALNIPPLIWHLKNRNIAACNLIVWTIFLNLCNLINAIIWPTDNVYNWSTGFVLCDIEVKLLLAATFGIPGSLACIMRALARVLDTERTILVPTMKQRRLETIITALLCFGGPVYAIGIHYVVQPSRYYIMAISGCTVSLDRSWPTMALVVIWPVILCLAATYYGSRSCINSFTAAALTLYSRRDDPDAKVQTRVLLYPHSIVIQLDQVTIPSAVSPILFARAHLFTPSTLHPFPQYIRRAYPIQLGFDS